MECVVQEIKFIRDALKGVPEHPEAHPIRLDDRLMPWLNARHQMRRDLNSEDRDKMVHAIAAGDRIGATSIFMSITERGLTEAQAFIKSLTAEVNAKKAEKGHRITSY